MEITVDGRAERGELEHFWDATGFTPAKILLDEDMHQAAAYYGSVPNDGLRHVRIHDLLTLVRSGGIKTEDPVHDWTDLDRALDGLVENDLAPFFEIMGSPSEAGFDFTDDRDVRAWKRFVGDLADHLQDRYGSDEVASWYFETWNEPDLGGPFGLDGDDVGPFCNYYDACSEGLREANDDLRFGGPGTVHDGDLFEGLMAHCADGENYFTGETGVRIDFISVHKKGATFHEEDIPIDTEGIVDRELDAVEYVREHHPELADTPFMNDECDPQTGWINRHTWRAGPFYPAVVCRVIDRHIDRLVDDHGVDYRLLSNDNGFLGEWGHRTHFTLIGEGVEGGHPENHHERPRLDAFELIKKPVHNVMTALSLLGDVRLGVSGDASDAVGTIATRRGDDQIAVLVYNGTDDFHDRGTDEVDLRVENLPFEEAAVAHYRIDGDHGNPFGVWTDTVVPAEPSLDDIGGFDLDADDLARFRRNQELALLSEPETVSPADDRFETSFTLPRPGVSILVLSARPEDPPSQPTGLRGERYRGTTFGNDLLLVWNDVEDRTVRSYEVLHADDPGGPFERVNAVDLLATAYLHVPERSADPSGYYAVRAVDYWGRRGPRSGVIDAADTALQ